MFSQQAKVCTKNDIISYLACIFNKSVYLLNKVGYGRTELFHPLKNVDVFIFWFGCGYSGVWRLIVGVQGLLFNFGVTKWILARRDIFFSVSANQYYWFVSWLAVQFQLTKIVINRPWNGVVQTQKCGGIFFLLESGRQYGKTHCILKHCYVGRF